MNTLITKIDKKRSAENTIYIVKSNTDIDSLNLDSNKVSYVKKMHLAKNNIVELNDFKHRTYIVFGETKGDNFDKLELYRKAGNSVLALINKAKITSVTVNTDSCTKLEILAFVEGMALGNYQFLKYKTGDNKVENSLKEISIYSKLISNNDIEELRTLTESVCYTRDYVNEPDSFMTAEQLAHEAKILDAVDDVTVTVFGKKEIEENSMGGLLAVNRGSINPPTFTIIEWKPKNAVNQKPYIFVGKGVVYDTGGLSLKPSNSMDTMKCDMAGGAAVIGAMRAITKLNLPAYVIGLIPATDNRPDGNAYTPGDVVTMHDGSTVEVLNTDAEGRMILADALSYAKKYNPALVIDIATLTGAAVKAIGPQAMVGMKVDAAKEFNELVKSGNKMHERIVEFPMWDEYAEQIKSEIADLKNIGGAEAGTITAGKFLQHFTNYPYIHLDIAAPAFLSKASSYRPVGGTGVGVRLFYDFIKMKVSR